MKEIRLPAKTENLKKVIDFVSSELEIHSCPLRAKFQIELAVEEIFVNIASFESKVFLAKA